MYLGVGGAGNAGGLRFAALAVSSIVLANCAANNGKMLSKQELSAQDDAASASAYVIEPGQPVPQKSGYYHVGKPYVVRGRTYVPAVNPRYSAVGIASWYGAQFHGRLTANGEIFDQNVVSAAHPTLPLPSYVRVTNLANQKSMVVRVNDRGPFAGDRIIDLSSKTAQLLGFHGAGLAKVKVDYIGPAPLNGAADKKVAHSVQESAASEQSAASERPIDTVRRNGPAPGEDIAPVKSGNTASAVNN